MKKIFLFGIVIASISFAKVNAQDISTNEFSIEKYKGNIKNFPITIILTFFPDHTITGYYYYDKVGKLIRLKSDPDHSNGLKIIGSKFEEYENDEDKEVFTFLDENIINKPKLKAIWEYKDKILPVVLNRDSSVRKWRMVRYQSYQSCNDCSEGSQKTDFIIVFPSAQSYPILNKILLPKAYQEGKFSKFINNQYSYNYTYESLPGQPKEDNCNELKSNSELVFISDSILTYRNHEYSYCNNGYEYETIKSYKKSTGELIKISNVFKEAYIDSALSVLKRKYENLLKEDEGWAPEISSYNEGTDIFLSNGGIYFRERLFKLTNYFDLFISYKEVENYLDESFKKTINCP